MTKHSFLKSSLVGVSALFLCACSTMEPMGDEGATSTVVSKSVPRTKGKKSASWMSRLSHKQTNDLWERLRNRFTLDVDTDNPRVAQYIQYYQQNPQHIRHMTERAEPYLYHVAEELDKRELPAELSLLPIVESGYDPFAKSRAGASGLWQIIPSTGQHLGLTQNRHYDGRRDVYDSTHAALNYLDSLSLLFDEDWLLSLAAYNSGEGTVSRAVAKNRTLGKDTDYWSLRLPQETQHYVPRFLALCAIIGDPDKYNVDLHPVKNAPFITSVPINKRVNLVSAAKLADTPLPTLQKLNAGVAQANSSYPMLSALRLPVEKADLFKTRLANFIEPPLVPVEKPKALTKKQNTKLAPKASLTKIAKKTCAHGTACEKTARHPVIVAKNEKVTAPTVYKKHTVKMGESLWSISRLYGISVAEIKRLNAHLQSALKPGDRIILALR